MYYPINEELARRAKESYSHFDYDEGSATYYYRVKVDETYAIAEEAKKTVDERYSNENIQKTAVADSTGANS